MTTTRRKYKKMAKRARDRMIAEGHAKPNHFWITPKGRDDVYVSVHMDIECRDELGGFEPLYGTPFFLPEKTDYWGEANEPECCIYALKEIQFWECYAPPLERNEHDW